MQKKILIAIITCRRPLGLKRLLTSLENQQIVSCDVDILVVDNACQPEIEALVDQQAAESQFEIHYQQEPVAGIVAARNSCVTWFLKRNFESLIFIDDDEWPADIDWLEQLVRAQYLYKTDIVTSHVLSVGEPGTPAWAVQLIYGKNLYKEGQKLTTYYTNNLLITRRVLETIQPAFDPRFAMTGASDYHFALRCTQSGFMASYTDAAVIEEFPKSRAKLHWFLRRGFRSGVGYSRSHMFEEPLVKAITRCLVMAVVRIFRGTIKIFHGIITLDKTRCTDGLFRFASAAGTIAGIFGIKHNEYQQIHGA